MKVISLTRKRKDFEAELGIDVVKIGTAIIHKQIGFDTLDDALKESVSAQPEDAREAFEAAVRRIESVRNVSSPILKVITLSRCMDELMGLAS